MLNIKMKEIDEQGIAETIHGSWGQAGDFGLPTSEYTQLIETLLRVTIEQFKFQRYHFLPMADDDEISDNHYYWSIQLRMNCKIRDLMFPILHKASIDGFLTIPESEITRIVKTGDEKQLYGKTSTKGETGSDTGTNTSNTTGNDFDITENAPINSLETINTPNFKAKSNSTHTSQNSTQHTTNKNVTETDGGTDTLQINRTDTHTHESPYLTERYFDLVTKYNLLAIAEKCIKSVIHEFNMYV